MNQIQSVTTWIDEARQEPCVRNIANYLAYTLSELAETLQEVSDVQCLALAHRMETMSVAMRNGDFDTSIKFADKVLMLDGAIDTVWTAIGLAHMLGNAEEAFSEVCASNYSKFVDGKALLDETGKVVKAEGYFKPNLEGLVR